MDVNIKSVQTITHILIKFTGRHVVGGASKN